MGGGGERIKLPGLSLLFTGSFEIVGMGLAGCEEREKNSSTKTKAHEHRHGMMMADFWSSAIMG